MLDIVVLAAGKGTRMKSNLPKVLHPVAGRPLLGHVLDTARSFDDAQLHVVIGHGAELVEQRLAGDDVQFVMQTEQLGTGHAVQQAAPSLRDDATVLILYGDVPLIKSSTLEQLVDTVAEGAMGLLTVKLEDPTGYGRIVRNPDGLVTAIVEQKDANPEQLTINEVNTGVMAMRNADLQRWLPQLSSDNAQQEYYLTDVIALAQSEGIVINTVNPDSEMEVLGVNNRQQQAELERYYQQHLAEQLMVEGVTLIDPSRFDCRGSLSAGSDVEIDINCVFEGDVKLGDNVKIGPNCVITNSRIGDNTVIKANSVLEDAVVADQCDIGPFARLRPGTNLSSKAKIGNFVETKKANIGVGSKVNHLTYIGDAEIGEGANIGAGTITCNYDGVNKSKTEIGDGAFIGSNSSLVAPVKIGAGATVGAGSTVAKDVEANQLAVARGKQRNIDNWPKPEKK
ncbi:bifunctional UDP-N-acetylglucosamine diphosphorylase/glucosamine-1-phosphate N-acetyltransferase GlmU [Maricurvus nonylphenolicus]|uniref:bifunctional UDP-N-acetylglucosamine diphosphorylase/glucosamine-1-phosphate N-acetyltransferase GlmU n=1 Tax=Maricurvus nonylphenolicus TaxID=1008307 RepID=UPI0036F44E3A